MTIKYTGTALYVQFNNRNGQHFLLFINKIRSAVKGICKCVYFALAV